MTTNLPFQMLDDVLVGRTTILPDARPVIRYHTELG